ncbi:DUF438 domain-containing protein [Latilactobacillus sakei]|uniref:DUF438 domain-containing protein n=1 Tax=Latilactobacillus sakei TaxID=1599 RepID=UPI00033A0AE1|nr:DUF438 domain-containing protein [Latilactobacillus sakei]EOR85439.1 hypothetical protein LS25_0519 [Latilactobacillus sakei subsp. sakei LS25]KGB14292.1 histidine kinase [Latilactobacillus sakei]PKX62957.1 DUF438 domain-containing protein [Latilactobacillus sakei]PKX68216.1 DUF438 domain-containing protein [Latilactobacillus sakei]
MTDQHSSAYRQKRIVEILKMLHNGGSFEEAKRIFDESFSGVDVSEITSAERELIASGLNPMEIQHLCNVHAAVFKGAINPNGAETPAQEQPGHPVAVLKLENLVINSLLVDELLPCLKKWQQSGSDQAYLNRMQQALKDLLTIDRHYSRKENLLFPLMDKYGITAPPKVMWGVDDQIRGLVKTAYQMVISEPVPDKYEVEAAIEKMTKEIQEMIFKEEEIMVPMVNEVFTPADWGLMAAESQPIGYTLIPEPLPWQPSQADLEAAEQRAVPAIAKELNAMAQSLADSQAPVSRVQPEVKTTPTKSEAASQIPFAIQGTPVETPETQATTAEPKSAEMPDFVKAMLADKAPAEKRPAKVSRNREAPQPHIEIGTDNQATIVLPSGTMNLSELTAILQVLPLDLTFVDQDDIVRWFSDNNHRIFPRTRAVLGRAVVNCHPPKSVDKVEKILADFHAGTEDHADFWINFRGKLVYIRYFAVRDPQQRYLGCLEVSQDITEIQALTGEKRL